MALESEALLLAVKIPTVFGIYYFLNRIGKEQRNQLVFFIGILLCFIAGILVYIPVTADLIYPYIFHQVIPAEGQDYQVMNAFMDIIFIAGLGYAFQQYNREKNWRKKEESLIHEKLGTELKFLKSQINPHFLFNTLNNIYGLARKNSADTPEAVLKLSEVLRYMLYDANTSQIEIGKEIMLIENYIEIERLRYGNRLAITFTKEVDNVNKKIAPLLLLHFVENAFKHGSSESRFDAFIRIQLTLKNNQLLFRVANSKESMTNEKEEAIGLKNIKRQLELIYPHHQLTIDVRETEFVIELNVALQYE